MKNATIKLPLEEEAVYKKFNKSISQNDLKINELDCIFNYNVLLNFASKEQLYKYWQLAIETQNKKYITIVDNVFNKRYPRFE